MLGNEEFGEFCNWNWWFFRDYDGKVILEEVVVVVVFLKDSFDKEFVYEFIVNLVKDVGIVYMFFIILI